MDREMHILWRALRAKGKVEKARQALDEAELEFLIMIENIKAFDNLRTWVKGNLS